MRRVVIEPVPPPWRVRRGSEGAGDPADADLVGVAVDVLRATSTLALACRHGAREVVPFADPAEALRFRERTPGALACGERGGVMVPGFDLGNSPFEYTAERVGGRTLAFASTNGSRTLLSHRGCRLRLLGAFVNASATVQACLASGAAQVRITGSGELGAPCPEDLACAGWLAARLIEQGFEPADAETAAAAAAAPAGAEAVRMRVEEAPHGRALAQLGGGYPDDVRWCATLDALAEAAHW